jgi:REP element-mobilizing transposase RayT
MPDHFHWLVELRNSALEDLALRVKSHTARNVNKALGRSGKFWQRGFHDRAIRYEEDLQSVARYIVANPVRAGLVRRVQDYPLWDALWV